MKKPWQRVKDPEARRMLESIGLLAELERPRQVGCIWCNRTGHLASGMQCPTCKGKGVVTGAGRYE